jgi:hypothetical protein
MMTDMLARTASLHELLPGDRTGRSAMPRISSFYGIVIEMYFKDHPPPHFRAFYAGEEAKTSIATGYFAPRSRLGH